MILEPWLGSFSLVLTTLSHDLLNSIFVLCSLLLESGQDYTSFLLLFIVS